MCVRLPHVSTLHLTAAALVALLPAADAFAQEPPPAEDAPSPAPSAQAPPAAGAPDVPTPAMPPAPPPASPDAPSTTGPAAAATAPGAEPPASLEPDVIYRADGSVVRGTVIEVVPNVEVRIRLATGEVATVARRDILHFEHLAPVPLEAQPPPAALRASMGSVGWVHIEDSDEARLEHASPGQGWIGVCASPCDTAVPTDGIYRIVGPNLETSRPFALGARGGEYETLHVHGGSHRAVTGGILLVALGLPLSLSVAFSMVGVSRLNGGGALTPVERTIEQGGLLAGGIAAVAGMALILTNLSTGVSQSVMPAPPTSAGPPYGSGISSLWKDAPKDARAAGPALPPAVGTPVFTVRF
jgi:hypothetical protein